MNTKKKMFLILSIIIIILIGIGFVFIKINNSEFNDKTEKTKSSKETKKSFEEGEEITSNELKEYFQEIYDKHILLCIGLVDDYESSEYPYISDVSIESNNELIIAYITGETDNNIGIMESYDMDGSEITHISLTVVGWNEEKEFNIITSLSSDKAIIGENLDLNISDGIRGALTDDSSELKVVKNKYGDPAWIVQKTYNNLDDGTKTMNIYLSKNNIDDFK